jgi:hemoglobin
VSAYGRSVQLRPGIGPRPSAYERWGGDSFFVTLVDRFYEGVATDPLLRPMYPDDLSEPRQHLTLFLAQYWGGPETYRAERGHPRLRMRHARFAVSPEAAEAWLGHMTVAVDAAGLPAEDRRELLDYFAMAARSLINTPV